MMLEHNQKELFQRVVLFFFGYINNIIKRQEEAMKYGARNQIKGEVTSIKKGSVMCEVKLKVLSCDAMESVMTMNSLKELGIKKGDKVRIVVKAVNVLLVKE